MYFFEKKTYEHFNSRPHKKVDVLEPDPNEAPWVFQLTTSQGGRPFLILLPPCCKYFNSRPHKEVDGYLLIRQT